MLSQVPNLDRHLGLCARRHRPQEARLGGQSVPNPTDSQPNPVRENAHFTGASAVRLRTRLTRSWQPADSIRLLTGQQ